MMDPTIWLQLGVSEQRYPKLCKEIESILKTHESVGNMMLMVRDSKLNSDEQLYAAYMIAKEDVMRKLGDAMPEPFKGVVKKIVEN